MAEALLDRRADSVIALRDPSRRAAALAMQDLGRALVAFTRHDRGATAVHATSSLRLRSMLGPEVETDRWLLDVAALATLGGAVDEVAELRDRVGTHLDSWRRTILDLLATGDEEVARDGLGDSPLTGPPLLLRAAVLTARLPDDVTATACPT